MKCEMEINKYEKAIKSYFKDKDIPEENRLDCILIMHNEALEKQEKKHQLERTMFINIGYAKAQNDYGVKESKQKKVRGK